MRLPPTTIRGAVEQVTRHICRQFTYSDNPLCATEHRAAVGRAAWTADIINGKLSNLDGVIEISWASRDKLDTAYHEAFHLVFPLLRPRELAVLDTLPATPAFRAAERAGEVSDYNRLNELGAYCFGAWAVARAWGRPSPITLNAAQTVLFERIYSGKVARRDEFPVGEVVLIAGLYAMFLIALAARIFGGW